MIPAPFRFLEMEKEELRTNAPQFDEAKLGVAPEALDPVDGSPAHRPPLFPSASSVVLAASELVFVVVNAPVFVTAQEQAIVAEQTVGIDGRFGKHLSLDDRLQFCPGAVFHHAGKDPFGFAQGRLLPPRLSSPMTGVLPPAPRPRRPRTRRGPK